MIITKAVVSLFPGFEKKEPLSFLKIDFEAGQHSSFRNETFTQDSCFALSTQSDVKLCSPLFLFRFSAKGGSRDRERGAMVQQTTNRTRNWEGGG